MDAHVMIEYDKQGRMKYNPDFHFKQGLKWSEEDIEYLCKFEHADHLESIAMALGRTKKSVAVKLVKLRKDGLYEYYKNLNKYW